MGNAQDDILVAGTTDYDQTAAALYQVLLQWAQAGASFEARVAGLKAATNPVRLTEGTVHDDHAADVLTGDAGQDWFIFNQDGDGGARDTAADLNTFEATYAGDIDFIQGP
jgi:Ca2+-binding RTX toxin-like protein